MFCHKCGKPLPADGAFCPSCGSPVATVAQAPANPPVPPAPVTPAANQAPIPTPASVPAPPVSPQPYIPVVEGGEPPAAPKKSRKGLVITLIAIAAVVVLAGAGVLSWYFIFRDTDGYSDSDDRDDEEDRDRDDSSRSDRNSSDSGYAPNSSDHGSGSSYPGNTDSSSADTSSPDSSNSASEGGGLVRETSDYATGASFTFRASSFVASLRSDPTFSGMPALSEWEQGVNSSNIPYYRYGNEYVALMLFVTGEDHSGYVAEIKLLVGSEKDTSISDDEIAAEFIPLVGATLGVSETMAENLVNDAYSAGSADYQSVKVLFQKGSDDSRAFYIYAHD